MTKGAQVTLPGPVVIVAGIVGQTPFAGVAWQALHYLEGLRRLGCDVYYVEDTGVWPYDPEQNTITADARYTVGYLARTMERYGFSGRWAYLAAADGGEPYGMTEGEIARLLARADAFVNLTGATVLREAHLRVPVRVYLETDPVLPQIEVARGRQFTLDLLSGHTHHFSYGENLGRPDCGVPLGPFRYRPTRQPVVLDWWKPRPGPLADAQTRFTTIGSWQQSGKDVEWHGEVYKWSKHHEFLKLIDLPGHTPHVLEMALAVDDDSKRLLVGQGWKVVDGLRLSRDLFPYRDYVLGSSAEFTVAKDQNVRLRSGWFSDRSATYLAAGKPVVTQDTAFGNVLPTGKGLFAFRTLDEVLAAFDAITSDYDRQSAAATEIAAEYFRAEAVLERLLEDCGL